MTVAFFRNIFVEIVTLLVQYWLCFGNTRNKTSIFEKDILKNILIISGDEMIKYFSPVLAKYNQAIYNTNNIGPILFGY